MNRSNAAIAIGFLHTDVRKKVFTALSNVVANTSNGTVKSAVLSSLGHFGDAGVSVIEAYLDDDEIDELSQEILNRVGDAAANAIKFAKMKEQEKGSGHRKP